MSPQWEKRRKRVFEIIEVGTKYDYPSRAYDLFNAFCILLNLTTSIMYTFHDLKYNMESSWSLLTKRPSLSFSSIIS